MARQASELAEIARQQTEELQTAEEAGVTVEEVAAEEAALSVEEAPLSPTDEEAPLSPSVEEPLSPTVEEPEPAPESPVEVEAPAVVEEAVVEPEE